VKKPFFGRVSVGAKPVPMLLSGAVALPCFHLRFPSIIERNRGKVFCLLSPKIVPQAPAAVCWYGFYIPAAKVVIIIEKSKFYGVKFLCLSCPGAVATGLAFSCVCNATLSA